MVLLWVVYQQGVLLKAVQPNLEAIAIPEPGFQDGQEVIVFSKFL